MGRYYAEISNLNMSGSECEKIKKIKEIDGQINTENC